MADDAPRLQATIHKFISRNFMGIHSADRHGFYFLVCLPSRFQVDARKQFSVYLVACMRNVSLVFSQRKYHERDAFGYREFISRQENCLPRRAPSDSQNYVRACRTQLFYRRLIRNVRGLRLFAFDSQSANNLLPVRDDLSVIGFELADEFADSFYARHRAIRRHDVTIRILGHADFLELANGAGAIPIYFATEPCVLFG